MDEALPAQLNSEKAQCLGRSMTCYVPKRGGPYCKAAVVMVGDYRCGDYRTCLAVVDDPVTSPGYFRPKPGKSKRCGAPLRAWNWTPPKAVVVIFVCTDWTRAGIAASSSTALLALLCSALLQAVPSSVVSHSLSDLMSLSMWRLQSQGHVK